MLMDLNIGLEPVATTMGVKTAETPSEAPADESNSLMNALHGAVVILITSPLLPFAAIFGGGVSGYLQRGSVKEGARVGAIAGVIAAVPMFAVGWILLGVFVLGMPGIPFGPTSSVAVIFFAGVVGYFGGAGALGGALGSYLRRQF